MMRIKLSACLLLSVHALLAQTPIEIDNSHMPGKDDTLRYTDISLSSIPDYLTTGENHYWDFTPVVSTNSGVRAFSSAAETPYPFFFFGSNEYGELIAGNISVGPLQITDVYSFYKKQNTPVSAFTADGMGVTFSGLPMPAYYSDRDELYLMPLKYGDRDSTTFKFATLATTLLPLFYSKHGYRITEVDGWGSISTPYGSEFCLRVVTTQYSEDTLKANVVFPISMGFQNYVRSYQWLTHTSRIPYFEVTGNLVMGNFTPTIARYRGYSTGNKTGLSEHSNAKLSVYPNPVNSTLRFSGLPAQVLQVRIISASGAVVWNAETEDESIDVSDLPAGLYVLEVRARDRQLRSRFTKE